MMDERIKRLKGSKRRDEFKYQHKFVFGFGFNAVDVDFIIVEGFKDPLPHLDYKNFGDLITWSEKRAYNSYLDCGIPVFIVVGYIPSTPDDRLPTEEEVEELREYWKMLKVYKYVKQPLTKGGVDPKNFELISENYCEWEKKIRNTIK